MSVILDKTDLHILQLLQEDAGLSVKAIGAQVGLTVSPTYDRINRLKDTGVIEKNVLLLNHEKLGLGVIAYCHISLKNHAVDTSAAFEKQVTLFREVMEVVRLSGNFDYMLKVVTADLKTYHEFVEGYLSRLPEISNLQTSFVMKELKRTTAYPI
ncbi:MAG: Lrp/AsnC family transcriptional regulator [Filimonas sp.]|nr:Lrp/AsnC family transcriptional regulator [Filimonas sp.]